MCIHYSWNEAKRKTNLRIHGIDFIDVPQVFAGLTFTYEDARFEYEEFRYVTLGLLMQTVVSIVHTEEHNVIRIISARKATRHEQTIYLAQIQN